ncbi:hypothetical protein GCM10020258_15420 [Sphingomonas yabuuchiae]
MPIARLLGVLEQSVGEFADRACPEADQDFGGIVGEPLEIAAQRVVCRRQRQRIMRLGEVIEPDGPVPRRRQSFMRRCRLREARRRTGQRGRVDPALARDQVGTCA